MKRILCLYLAISMASISVAQTDSTHTEAADTIKIGGTIIIRKKTDYDSTENNKVISADPKRKKNFMKRINWWVLDLGFANYNDRTNYAAAIAQGFVQPGMDKDALDLRSGKSVNVNIWLFLQRKNLIRRVVNLKYGLGLEMNNYRFDNPRVFFRKDPTIIYLDEAYKDSKKSKLAIGYVTVPLLMNFNFTPRYKNGYGFSGGISIGYLYGAHQKIKFDGSKYKLHDDFNLRKWKLSWIGELNLRPVRLYGSYALKSLWEKSLDQTPYTIGVRFSRY